MADHFSGPRALADPASDITDVFAFPSPERRGHLVLVLDVFPFADPAALFSDALRYRFRPRPVMVTTASGTPAFVAGADEYRPWVAIGQRGRQFALRGHTSRAARAPAMLHRVIPSG